MHQQQVSDLPDPQAAYQDVHQSSRVRHYSSGGPGGSFDDLASNEEFEVSNHVQVEILGGSSENVNESIVDSMQEEDGNVSDSNSDGLGRLEPEKGNSISEAIDSMHGSAQLQESSRQTERPRPNVGGRYFEADDGSPMQVKHRGPPEVDDPSENVEDSGSDGTVVQSENPESEYHIEAIKQTS